MTTKGFTLVELLVVIAIIALLAAILLPALARARESEDAHPAPETSSTAALSLSRTTTKAPETNFQLLCRL